MDTIQVAIILNENRIKGIPHQDLQEVCNYINNFKSPYGYTYCDCLEISEITNIIVKISYPRFYAGINAFLITNSAECFQVQNDFSIKLKSHYLLCDAQIELARVDIPFTYYMTNNFTFRSYKKIYQIFNYIYKKKNKNSNPKAITDVEELTPETLVYADTATISGYNKKITIYNQYNNLKAKTGNEIDLYNLEAKYEGIQNRMRIEVSNRISRKPISIQDFVSYNIFDWYRKKYKDYLVDNIFDLNEVNNFYNEKSVELANRLLNYREETNNFLYETFIYKEVERIHDYEIIRRALKICIDNLKTREKAITVIRRVLFKYQLNENIIVMDTYNTIIEMKKVIETYY